MVRMRRARAVRAVRQRPCTTCSIRPAPVTRRDWLGLLGLGLVGHCLYQYLFVGGLAQTSVANSALLVAATPVAHHAHLARRSAHERVGRLHWAGTLLSLAGIYIVVGRGAHIGGSSLRGDLMMMGAVVLLGDLHARRAAADGAALAGRRDRRCRCSIGTMVYVPAGGAAPARVPLGESARSTWVKLVYSALFALCVAYTIWYAAVRADRQRADLGLLEPGADRRDGDRVSCGCASRSALRKIAGAAAVLAGVVLTGVATRRVAAQA